MSDDSQTRTPADNPAAELHRIFTEWSSVEGGNVQQHSAVQLRKLNGRDAGTLDEHRQAVRLLEAIMLWLDEAKRSDAELEAYVPYVSRWAQAIFHYPGNWQSAGGANHFTPDMLSSLRILGSMMRALGVRLDTERLASTLDLLREIEQEAEDDDELPDDLREFLRTTVHELRKVYVDYSRANSFDFKLALKSMKIALDLAAVRSGRKRRIWEGFGSRWAAPVTVNALGGVASSAGIHALGMLGG